MARNGGRALRVTRPALFADRVPTPSHLLALAAGEFRLGLDREGEQRRLFPWLAVAFGIGILVYFTGTDGTPTLAAPLVAAGFCLGLTPLLQARPAWLALVLGLGTAFLGFAACVWRVNSVAGPILTRTIIAPLVGVVEGLEEREGGARLIVRVESFGDLTAAAQPRRVRVSYKAGQSVRPGDTIRATARLLPPPEAARPGGYDFARDAYFRGIGAIGSLSGKVEIAPRTIPLPFALKMAASIDEARNHLTRRIADAIGGQAGAVAAALVTGKRGLITEETNRVLRAAGIYHVVSISGLHMVLAAGVVFWLVRASLALVPILALTFPIKKIAAGTAMVGVTAYCAFSGWDVAAERALIMTLVMLGAVLVDRPALSMRNLALAAILALAREPEALLGPSFQMSFAAVAGLIACAPLLDGASFRRERDSVLLRVISRCLAVGVGTLATTLVAQIATAPFATYHFQTIQPFGLIGNALTLPLVSLAVMPAAVLGMIAYPFTLDRPVWWVMGLAVRGMLDISEWIAGFGQSTVVLPAFGAGALVLLALALLLVTLPVSRLRGLAILPAAIGLAAAATPARFDLYIDRDGAGAVIRGTDGRLAVLGRPPTFVLEQWLKADGDARSAASLTGGPEPRCDRLGCTMTTFDGRTVALVLDKRAFEEDCARADILISRLRPPPNCRAPLRIDKDYLETHGATAIRLGAPHPEIVTARSSQTPQPWQARPVAVAPATNPAAREKGSAVDPGATEMDSLQ